MFCLSVVDHVRLNFGQTAQNYTVHAEAAERLAGYALKARLTILALLVMTAVATVTAVIAPARNFNISAAMGATLALIAWVVYVAIGLEGRIHAHRTCAHRLRLVCERYRSLLAELQDGMIDPATLTRRRDDLIDQVQAAYDQAFPLDQHGFEATRLSGGHAVSDEEIDRLLPESLRRQPNDRAA